MPLNKDTVTIITGASSGIGAATAIKLAQSGTRIILAARSEDKLNKLAGEINDNGGKAEFRVTDVTDRDDIRELISSVVKKYGRVDHLINNAGLMLFSDWADTAVDDWSKMIDTNIHGYLNAIAAILPVFLEQKRGHILNMSSVAGLHTGVSSGVYSATKFFIRGVTESLRKEVGVENGIQVSMISPGVIDTGWADKVNDRKGKEAAKKLNEIAITPEQVADAVAYALDKPDEITINDIVIHPTRQDW